MHFINCFKLPLSHLQYTHALLLKVWQVMCSLDMINCSALTNALFFVAVIITVRSHFLHLNMGFYQNSRIVLWNGRRTSSTLPCFECVVITSVEFDSGWFPGQFLLLSKHSSPLFFGTEKEECLTCWLVSFLSVVIVF